MRIPRSAAVFALAFATSLSAGCTPKDGADGDTAAAAEQEAGDSLAVAVTASGAASATTPAASQPAVEATSAPLTVADVDRWKKGMEAELKAVQDAAAKYKSAKTQADSAQVVGDVLDFATKPIGARAAGVSEDRYNFMKQTFESAVAQLTPAEQEGFGANMPAAMRAEFEKGREAALARSASSFDAGVIDALRPRAVELRKQSLTLAGARVKALER